MSYHPARLLQLHISEQDRHAGRPLWEAVIETCRRMGMAGATVFRGLEGYGGAAEIHRAHLMGEDLPIIVTVVDAPDKIAALAPVLEGMLEGGIRTIEEVTARRVELAPPAGSTAPGRRPPS